MALTIYCEAEIKPEAWEDGWSKNNVSVLWYSENQPEAEGNYWHYDENGKVVTTEFEPQTGNNYPSPYLNGTFENSATDNSPLFVEVLYDCNDEISIFLYEICLAKF